MYHRQYSEWRDSAIESAQRLFEQGKSSVIISLDIKRCFYNMTAKWDTIPGSQSDEYLGLPMNLTKILESIHIEYRKKIFPVLKETHAATDNSPEGIPIGLPSSRVLANWIITPFDKAIQNHIMPAYYGRYVDDMLIVAVPPPKLTRIRSASEVVETLLIREGLLQFSDGQTELILETVRPLTIQAEKLIVHFFDKNHSRAGLKEFIKEIKTEASEFRFLPIEDRERELDSCAYDIIYEGSINKLRSVIGISENSTELSKYLARRIIDHRLTSDALNETVEEQLDRFSQGKNLLDFYTTWERILTLLITKGKGAKASAFLTECSKTVERISTENDQRASWIAKAKSDLLEYLQICLAMALGLRNLDDIDRSQSKRLQGNLHDKFSASPEYARSLRESNLIRHQWVSWPLLNYTSYGGSLVGIDVGNLEFDGNWDIERKLALTPRYVHYDERQLFALLVDILSENSSLTPADVPTSELNDPKFPKQSQSELDGFVRITTFNCDQPEEDFAIGIANLCIHEENIIRSFDTQKVPNISWERQSELFALLNLTESY